MFVQPFFDSIDPKSDLGVVRYEPRGNEIYVLSSLCRLIRFVLRRWRVWLR